MNIQELLENLECNETNEKLVEIWRLLRDNELGDTVYRIWFDGDEDTVHQTAEGPYRQQHWKVSTIPVSGLRINYEFQEDKAYVVLCCIDPKDDYKSCYITAEEVPLCNLSLEQIAVRRYGKMPTHNLANLYDFLDIVREFAWYTREDKAQEEVDFLNKLEEELWETGEYVNLLGWRFG